MFFFVQLLAQLLLLLQGQPLDRLEAVRQALEHHQPEQDDGRTLDDEHPLPAAQAAKVMKVLEDATRERTTDDTGHRHRDCKQCGYLRSAAGRIPAVEKHQYARKKPGLGHPQQRSEGHRTP